MELPHISILKRTFFHMLTALWWRMVSSLMTCWSSVVSMFFLSEWYIKWWHCLHAMTSLIGLSTIKMSDSHRGRAVFCNTVAFKLEGAWESPGISLQHRSLGPAPPPPTPECLMKSAWAGAQELAPLASSQVMPMLQVQGPQSENHRCSERLSFKHYIVAQN